MKKELLYFCIIVAIVFVSACSPTIQTFDLSKEYATSLHYEGSQGDGDSEEDDGNAGLVGVPAKGIYGGDLKRGGLWWGGKGIFLEKGDVFTFNINTDSADVVPFGATFPPLDFLVEDVVIKVTARAEGSGSDSLKLYLQLDDASGYQANAKRPFQVIKSSKEFHEYYFTIRDMFLQSEPKKHSVNGAMINSLKFFINPGVGYQGKILIKEVKVIAAPSAK